VSVHLLFAVIFNLMLERNVMMATMLMVMDAVPHVNLKKVMIVQLLLLAILDVVMERSSSR
jgi:hypothetical protein